MIPHATDFSGVLNESVNFNVLHALVGTTQLFFRPHSIPILYCKKQDCESNQSCEDGSKEPQSDERNLTSLRHGPPLVGAM
jgi:hypothetical protein